MQVALRGLDGAVSGAREVAAPASCAERARVAAVLISAWVGAWSAGSFPEPTRPPASAESAPRPAGASGLPDAATAASGRGMVEPIAVAGKPGLSEDDAYWLVRNRHERNRTLTQTHNERGPRGRSMVTFGGVTTGVGTVLLAVGLVLSGDVTYESGKGNVTSGWGYAGNAMAITGGVGVAAGLSITILGLYRWTTPPTDDTQGAHTGSNRQALRPSASAQRKSATRWALSPSLGPRQAGLGLVAAF